MFDTKIAIVLREDLATWQKLNVTAFLATGIASAAPHAMGEAYFDAAGQRYTSLLGQPMMVFLPCPQRAHENTKEARTCR